MINPAIFFKLKHLLESIYLVIIIFILYLYLVEFNFVISTEKQDMPCLLADRREI